LQYEIRRGCSRGKCSHIASSEDATKPLHQYLSLVQRRVQLCIYQPSISQKTRSTMVLF
jgi:hypothetical protein